MKGQFELPLTRSATATALAAAIIVSPIGVVSAPANSLADVKQGATDVHYHRIFDHRGGVPLIAGLALGLIGAAAVGEHDPHDDNSSYQHGRRYYGGPYVGSYSYPESPPSQHRHTG